MREHLESHWSDLNRRPLDYESSALPLSYSGDVSDHALARIRTATPFGTTPSRWRVYQFHHQGVAGTRRPGRGAEPAGGAGLRRPSIVERCCARTMLRAGLTGLEPATSGVTDRHSNQLSYSPKLRRAR